MKAVSFSFHRFLVIRIDMFVDSWKQRGVEWDERGTKYWREVRRVVHELSLNHQAYANGQHKTRINAM